MNRKIKIGISIIIIIIPFIFIYKIMPTIKEKESTNNQNTHTINNWDKEKVTIKINNISEDKKEAIIIIEDKNDIPVTWDMSFAIQKLSEANVWYKLKAPARTEFLNKVASPNELGITKIEINWYNIYGELSKGTYRIVKNNGFISLYSEPFEI